MEDQAQKQIDPREMVYRDMCKAFADPVYRYGSNPNNRLIDLFSQSSTALDEHLEQWIMTSTGFLEYLEAHQRHAKCLGFTDPHTKRRLECSPMSSCMGDLNDQEIRRSMVKQWSGRVSAFARPATDSLTHHCRGLYFACAACGIELTTYDPGRLPLEQDLTTFRFLWTEPDSCRTVFNASHMVCQACYQLWILSNCENKRFTHLVKTLFRPNPGCDSFQNQRDVYLNPDERAYFENRVDILKWSSSASRKKLFDSDDTLSAVWAIQGGLVRYPVPLNASDASDHEYQSREAEWKEEFYQMYHLLKHKQLTGRSNITAGKTPLTSLEWSSEHSIEVKKEPQAEKKKIDNHAKTNPVPNPNLQHMRQAEHKKRKIEHHVSQQCQLKNMHDKGAEHNQGEGDGKTMRFVEFWIPIHPNISTRSLLGVDQTARDPSRPLSAQNYYLTVNVLRQIERQFEYSQFFNWLCSVSYWNLKDKTVQEKWKCFVACRFKRYDAHQSDSLAKRFTSTHPYLVKPDNRPHFFANPILPVTKPLSDGKKVFKRFFIPCINYQDKQHIQDIQNYVESEIRRWPQSVLAKTDPKQVSLLCEYLLQYLSDHQQLARLKHDLIQYYNEHVHPLLVALQKSKEEKRRLDRIIEPVIACLQKHQCHKTIFDSTGLYIQQNVREPEASKFHDLTDNEKVEFLHEFLPLLKPQDVDKVEKMVQMMDKSEVMDAILGQKKSFSEKLTIYHPTLRNILHSGPKRLKSTDAPLSTDSSGDVVMQIKNTSKKVIKPKPVQKVSQVSSDWLMNHLF